MSWRPSRRRLWIDLTPLIDVVFTLLLFVIVTAQFASESALPMELPKAAERPATPRESLIVSVTDHGIYLDKTLYADAEIAAAVEEKGEEPVVVRAEGRVSYERVFGVLAALQKAGINDVGLAYEPLP